MHHKNITFISQQGSLAQNLIMPGFFLTTKTRRKNPFRSASPERDQQNPRSNILRSSVFFNHKGTKKKSSFIIFPIKNPSGTIVPKGLKYFFSVKLCVLSVYLCVIITLKNPYKSAFPEGISKIRVPNYINPFSIM